MLCNKKYNLDNNFENNAWKLEHKAEKLQEILSRKMHGIVSIINSALVNIHTKVSIHIYSPNHRLVYIITYINQSVICRCVCITIHLSVPLMYGFTIAYQTSSSEPWPRKVELKLVHSKNITTVCLYT